MIFSVRIRIDNLRIRKHFELGILEGFYSFKIKEDTTVEVSGVYTTERNSITFDKGDKDGNDYRVTFNVSPIKIFSLLSPSVLPDCRGIKCGIIQYKAIIRANRKST